MSRQCYRGALVAHTHSFAPSRCRTSQYFRTFAPHPTQCLFGSILVTLCLMMWDFRVSRTGICFPPVFFFCLLLFSIFLSYCFLFLSPTVFSFCVLLFSFFVSYCFLFFILPWVRCVGLGSSDWYGVFTFSQPCAVDSFLIMIIIIILHSHRCKTFTSITTDVTNKAGRIHPQNGWN